MIVKNDKDDIQINYVRMSILLFSMRILNFSEVDYKSMANLMIDETRDFIDFFIIVFSSIKIR